MDDTLLDLASDPSDWTGEWTQLRGLDESLRCGLCYVRGACAAALTTRIYSARRWQSRNARTYSARRVSECTSTKPAGQAHFALIAGRKKRTTRSCCRSRRLRTLRISGVRQGPSECLLRRLISRQFLAKARVKLENAEEESAALRAELDYVQDEASHTRKSRGEMVVRSSPGADTPADAAKRKREESVASRVKRKTRQNGVVIVLDEEEQTPTPADVDYRKLGGRQDESE